MLNAFRVWQLVAKTAFQPAAEARELRRVEAEVLLLGHLDRHRLERVEERGAAERAAAGAVAAVHLGLVAHADLAHLDARAEFGGELADQLAEIDAAVGGEIENQLRAVERLLHARELHAEAALPNFQQRDPVRFLLAMLVLHPRDDVVARGDADHSRRLIAGGRPPGLELRDVAHHRAERGGAVALDDDRVAAPRRRLRLAEDVRVRAADRRQLHGHDRRACRRHSCSTTQSATIFVPALRGGASATSARSTASTARTPRSRGYAAARRSSAGRASGFASSAASAPVASTSTSRSSEAIARRYDDSRSRSAAPPEPTLVSRSFAASIRRAGSRSAAAAASTPPAMAHASQCSPSAAD